MLWFDYWQISRTGRGEPAFEFAGFVAPFVYLCCIGMVVAKYVLFFKNLPSIKDVFTSSPFEISFEFLINVGAGFGCWILVLSWVSQINSLWYLIPTSMCSSLVGTAEGTSDWLLHCTVQHNTQSSAWGWVGCPHGTVCGSLGAVPAPQRTFIQLVLLLTPAQSDCTPLCMVQVPSCKAVALNIH